MLGWIMASRSFCKCLFTLPPSPRAFQRGAIQLRVFTNRFISFKYFPLREPQQIRLLKLFAGRPWEKIRGECIQVSIDSAPAPTFTAISYTWGDRTIRHQISLDDCDFDITQNVYDVLRHIRSPRDDQLVWIDSICINQNDISEKNEQVRLMGRIYSSAETVWVWLGLESEDSALAMRFLPTLAEALFDLRSQFYVHQDVLFKMTSTQIDSPQWDALDKLFKRPWFQRLWVLQEVALASSVKIVCGDDSLPVDLVRIVAMELARRCWLYMFNSEAADLSSDTTRRHGLVQIWNMTAVGHNLRKGIPLSLEEALYLSSTYLATDPRDKIYGILGLAGNTTLSPDYGKGVLEVYIDAMKDSFERTHSLGILSLAGIGHNKELEDLPSWVPGLTIVAGPVMGLDKTVSKIGYAASNRISAYYHFHCGSLTVKALKVDTIKTIGKTLTDSSTLPHRDNDVLDPGNWVLEALSRFIKTSKYRHMPEKVAYEAVWQPLIANRAFLAGSTFGEESRAPAIYEKYFGAFLGVNSLKNTSANLKDQAEHFRKVLFTYHFRKRYCVTASGDVGIVPRHTAVGDIVCIFLGAAVPFLARPNPIGEDGTQTYSLVSECYIHGLMNGEGLKMGEAQDLVLR